MKNKTVSFNRPPVLGSEIDQIAHAIASGKLSGDGEYTKRCHALLERLTGAPKALLTHSCTAALEMAAILCELGASDEVIVPSFTFVSTANAIVLRGAVPVFVDIDPVTMNIDPAAIEAAITPRTKAIFLVHYGGVPCDMDAINRIAATRGLVVVEDAAQALGSRYKGRPAGALGTLAAFSFHETKNLVCGEGGALIVNDGSELAGRAEIIREKGTNRSRFFRGEVDKYTWVDIGSSYLPSELQAAFLHAQLERIDEINSNRLATWHLYHEAFADLASAGRVQVPAIPAYAEHNAHIYFLVLDEAANRDGFIAALRKNGVMSVFHYVPLHSSPAGLKYCRAADDLRVTDSIAERLVRLPLYYGISEDERAMVIDAVRAYFAA